jgi:alpha-1,2-mannosyltransferase
VNVDRPALRWTVIGLGVAYLCIRLAVDGLGLDLDVYLHGGRALLHGHDLYAPDVAVRQYGFTYPPFAALPIALLAPLPTWLALAVDALVFFVALVMVFAASAPGLLRAVGRSWPAVLLVVAAAGGQPVWETLRLGQINMVLAALVLWDLRPGNAAGWRGALTGIATGIKLTPGLFVVYLLVMREWRAARNAVLAFVGTVALAFAVAPGDSVRYWGTELYATGRIGDPHRIDNQSLLGLLLRELPSDRAAHVLWVPVAAGALFAVLLVARRLTAAGQRILALGVVGVGSCLLAPITWPHHWVWLVPVLCGLVRSPWWQRTTVRAGAVALVVATLIGSKRPGVKLSYDTWWGRLVFGNVYVWAGLGLLAGLYAVTRGTRQQPSGQSMPHSPSEPSARGAAP